jgi:four helix bundle protein
MKKKKKTFNAQRSASNIQWDANGHAREEPPRYAGSNKKDSTLNAQPAYAEGFGVAGAHLSRRSESEGGTLNVQWNIARENEGNYSVRKADTNGTKGTEPKFDLEDRLLEFTARLLKLVDTLPTSYAGNHIAGQLLRCGTSPFANHGEVQAAESRKDFIHKLGVCFKELKEIKRWLRLIGRVELISLAQLRPLLDETEELIRIFSASIRTAERNRQ